MSLLNEIPEAVVDQDILEQVAAMMDLRRPNREAVESLALALSDHYDAQQLPPTFEAVIVSATAVGKTYVLAGALDYLVQVRGIRNFAVITPGSTILTKTVNNFTPGHAKSLLNHMSVRPVVITVDNFRSPAVRSAMDDPDQVKLYIFTVQSLTRPNTNVGRRTHSFQETLGAEFYAYLQALPDLVVFADEHHCYYGQAFSNTVRDLRPYALVGLTATPHPHTPHEEIIYRYPLAAAIADRLVKTPVLVGRSDDRTDAETKLNDGAQLLELKEHVMAQWCRAHGREPVRPVMLVIAQTIEDARHFTDILQSPDFRQGRYADTGSVLLVTSESSDAALAQLEAVEDPSSPARIIVSVGMLKEGWDVKNVYVICSIRASVSEILTEQTLGRGLRLPFGAYTGEEMLDTLEVVAHERYDELLRHAGALTQSLIQYRVRTVVKSDSEGHLHTEQEETPVSPHLLHTLESSPSPAAPRDDAVPARGAPLSSSESTETGPHHQPNSFMLKDQQTREREAAAAHPEVLRPRPEFPPITIPVMVAEVEPRRGSLVDVANRDLDRFRRLGARLGVDPDNELRRAKLQAEILEGSDGFKQTAIRTVAANNPVVSLGLRFPLDDSIQRLNEAVMSAPFVLARREEAMAAREIIQIFVEGMNGDVENLLSAYLSRASALLIQELRIALKEAAGSPRYTTSVDTYPLEGDRVPPPYPVIDDRLGPFVKEQRYSGWRRSLYAEAWFDSSPERDVANMLDQSQNITCWVRLRRSDLRILWQDENRTARWYSPDFVAIDTHGHYWLIEVKADDAMRSVDVLAKREAARVWARTISRDETLKQRWHYVLASETDVATVHGSWPALQRLAEQ